MTNKNNSMKNFLKAISTVMLIFLVSACSNEGGKQEGSLAGKKTQLEKLKKDQADIADKIAKLQDEIAKLDTSAANAEKPKLVTLSTIEADTFAHYIDLQGKIDANNVSYVTPRGMGGQVKGLYVKQGDYVKKGQLLLKLDEGTLRQQMEQANIQLSYLKDLYQRRKNLWEQNIGTEVEMITAKNNMTNAQKQLDLLNEQLSFTNVYSDVSGVANIVNIRMGETFTGAGQIQIVNNNDIKAIVQVPENYLGKVRKGSELVVVLPEINKTIKTRATVVGQIIDPNSRSFYVEAKLPADKDIRPNQIALVKIKDYEANNAITIPVNTIQNDEKGKYVLIAANENGKMVAQKREVQIGELYGNKLEVKSGLQPGDKLITDGFQGLYDGQFIITETNG
jgi:membrane fusion protein, multidrug efflux system